MKSVKSDFISSGVRCDGDLYLPEGAEKPPVVIMAHGMAAQKDFRLPAYAERFVEKNMAAFLFDYRTFGKSNGEPRQLVDPDLHVQDWQAAISHVRNLKNVDGARIALWGSSFSGGHVITCAAADHDIRAVVSQLPFVSGWSSTRLKGISDVLQCTFYGVYDLIRGALGLSPHYSPVIARPGFFAAMNTEESYPGYMSIAGDNPTWENKMASRAFIKASLYSPISRAKQVKAPTLVMAGKYDSLIPVDAVRKMAGRLPKGELVVMDCNHFEPYTGELFEQFVARQSAFLATHLK
ncbi:MAG: alpha/beta fold hydrolase [Desulfobacteraceae bacterium]|nr:MAG: alpha/beta fold hydrolase [Desulfobacteraceae bacterium]